MADRQFTYRWTRSAKTRRMTNTAFDVHPLNSISRGGWYGAMTHPEWFGSAAGTAEPRDQACHEVERQYEGRIAAAKSKAESRADLSGGTRRKGGSSERPLDLTPANATS